MKVIVAGSRILEDYDLVSSAIRESGFEITEVVSGCARGVDSVGIDYARRNNIPITKFPANWDKHGKSAGVIRNIQMAKYADGLVAVWDGRSKGTGHMIRDAIKRGLKVYVKTV